MKKRFTPLPTMRTLRPLLPCLLSALLLSSVPARAGVNDIFPGDYFPLAPGARTLSVYAIERDQQGPYAGGHKSFAGHIDTSIAAMRLTQGFQLGGLNWAGVLVLPWTDSRVAPLPLATALGRQADGVADLRLGLTSWLINDKANANYLGVSGMVIAPTGAYDAEQVLNPGENRWKLVLSGGWQKDLTPRLLIELSPEIVFYGDNDDYAGQRRLEQHSSTALTTYLRYRISTTWHVHVGGQINRGGETRINGIAQHNPANNTRLMAGVSWFLPGQQQLILRVARDNVIDNGFYTDREVALRYNVSF